MSEVRIDGYLTPVVFEIKVGHDHCFCVAGPGLANYYGKSWRVSESIVDTPAWTSEESREKQAEALQVYADLANRAYQLGRESMQRDLRELIGTKSEKAR